MFSIRTTPASPVSVAHPALPFYFFSGKPVTVPFKQDIKKKKELKKGVKGRKATIIFFNQHSYERSLIIIALNTLELQSAFQTLTNESRNQGGKASNSSILSFPAVMGFRLGCCNCMSRRSQRFLQLKAEESLR